MRLYLNAVAKTMMEDDSLKHLIDGNNKLINVVPIDDKTKHLFDKSHVDAELFLIQKIKQYSEALEHVMKVNASTDPETYLNNVAKREKK